MIKRLIVALLVLPLFVYGMLFAPPVYFRLFTLLALFMGYTEYRHLMDQKGWTFSPWPGASILFLLLVPQALAGLVPVVPVFAPGEHFATVSGIALIFLFMAGWSVTHSDLEKGLPRFFAELCGPVYLGVLGLHILKLHALTYGGWWIFILFWYAWIYDAGALFVGKPFGKRKFSPLSPSKTWEGFWGGIALCALVSFLLLPRILPVEFPLKAWQLGMLSIPAAALAQVGDLFESMLKRHAGVKDSSAIIPANGGFLDKLDSSLFVAPFLFVVATLMGVK